MKLLVAMIMILSASMAFGEEPTPKLSYSTKSTVTKVERELKKMYEDLKELEEKLTERIMKLRDKGKDDSDPDVKALMLQWERVNAHLSQFDTTSIRGTSVNSRVAASIARNMSKIKTKQWDELPGRVVTVTNSTACGVYTDFVIEKNVKYILVPHPDDKMTRNGWDRTKKEEDQDMVTAYESGNLWSVVIPKDKTPSYMVGITNIIKTPYIESEEGGKLLIRRHGGPTSWKGSIRVKIINIE